MNNDYILVSKAQDKASSQSEHATLDMMLNKLRSIPGAKLTEAQRAIAMNLLERP